MDNNEVIFGLMAPPMIEQFPQLSQAVAAKLDEHNKAISHCGLNCLITRKQRDEAYRRLTRYVHFALSAGGAA